MEQRLCPGCKAELVSLGNKTFQLGTEKFFSLIDEHLLQGGICFEIMVCPACGKIELYAGLNEDGIESIDAYIAAHRDGPTSAIPDPEPPVCSACGKPIEYTQFICPHCGHDYRTDLIRREPEKEKTAPDEKTGLFSWLRGKEPRDPW